MTQDKIKLAGLYFFFFIIFILFAGKYQSADGAAYFYGAVSIANGKLSSDEVKNVLEPLNMGKLAKNNHFYIKYGLGFPAVESIVVTIQKIFKVNIINVKVYFKNLDIERFLLPKVLNCFLSALICTLMFCIARYYSLKNLDAIFIAVFLAFSTPILFYSSSDLSEPLQALFLLFLYVIIFIYGEKNIIRAFYLAAIISSMLLLIKPIYLLISPIVLFIFYLKFRAKKEQFNIGRLVLFFIPVFLTSLLYLYWNYVRYANYFDFGEGMLIFDNNFLNGLYGLYFSPGKSIFIYAPLALLAFSSIFYVFKNRRLEVIFIVMSLALFSLVYSKYHFWHGDFAWGPRYLIPFLPLLFILIIFILNIKKRFINKFFILFGFLGFCIQLLAVLSDPNDYLGLYYSQIEPLNNNKVHHREFAEIDKEIYSNIIFSPIVGHYWLAESKFKKILKPESENIFSKNPWGLSLPHPEYAVNNNLLLFIALENAKNFNANH